MYIHRRDFSPFVPYLTAVQERPDCPPFKEKYKSEHKKEIRVAMAKSEILTGYFNYLHSQNMDPPTDQERMKKAKFLLDWIANNWQCQGRSEELSANLCVRPIEVLWKLRKEECEEEIREILNVEELDWRAPEYFQQRLAGAKVVLDRLTVPERLALEAEVNKIKTTGHKKEVQQQLALKHAEQR